MNHMYRAIHSFKIHSLIHFIVALTHYRIVALHSLIQNSLIHSLVTKKIFVKMY